MSLRSKLEDFFNPGPAAKAQTKGIDEDDDIYNHVG